MDTGALRTYLDGLPAELLAGAARGRGKGCRVAIVDSGVDGNHPALRGRVTRALAVHEQAGVSGVTRLEAAQDSVGHGTACADIVLTLAPDAELWSVQALGSGCRGSPAGLLAALRYCIQERADIINLSLGTRDPRVAEPLRELIDEAYRRSILIVVAANNVPGVASYPAVFSSLVAVDAMHSEDREHFTFRFGKLSELEAPGIYIDAAWPGGGRKLVTGTSFACPHVAGHIARILSANPGMPPFQVKTVLFAMGQRAALATDRNVENAR